MPRFRTLTQRFGALYGLLLVLMIGVSTAVTLHLRSIQVDSGRLVEEAREQAVAARLISEIDSLEALLQQPSGIDLDELARARALLRATTEELSDLEGHEDDPSRPEHQRAESRIGERLAEELALLDALLSPGADAARRTGGDETLSRSKHFARVLLSEARDEASEADQDLQGRVRATRAFLAATWMSSLLLLGVALGLIHRGVVRPLRTLRDGTERFGRGERDFRIRVQNSDEIGSLARSFNAMADRLAHAQDDLEERVKQRTREFIRAARLADLGLLASGIAHEINTPLASISSSAEGLLRKIESGDLPPELLREYARVIAEEAFRAREISTRMLALVRQEPSEISSVPLRLVVQQSVSALRHRAEQRGVELEARPVADDVTVEVNAGELVQVLVNLLSNAIDASPGGGRVSLDVEVRDDRLVLEVADAGSGIPEEDLDRIFEPFYTTKGPSAGTGLGLALVATMVEFRGGTVSVRSEVGRGSTFRVETPSRWSESR